MRAPASVRSFIIASRYIDQCGQCFHVRHDGFVNQGPKNVDHVADWISASEAVTVLGIKRETLYAYASRGLVRTAAALHGSRARVYQRQDVERLKARSRARSGHGAVAAGALRWGEPVLETSVGTIRPDGPAYR